MRCGRVGDTDELTDARLGARTEMLYRKRTGKWANTVRGDEQMNGCADEVSQTANVDPPARPAKIQFVSCARQCTARVVPPAQLVD
jgi:hypothetical protein